MISYFNDTTIKVFSIEQTVDVENLENHNQSKFGEKLTLKSPKDENLCDLACLIDNLILFCYQDSSLVLATQENDQLIAHDTIYIENYLPLRFISKNVISKDNLIITCSDLKQFGC